MSRKRVAVIGAGPAGLTAAYQLRNASAFELHVFEASSCVGGMARSLQLWGHTVDLGPHRFFSADKRLNSLWLELMERDYRMVQRQTRIFYNGRFYEYPLQVGNALRQLGPLEASRCLISYLRAQVSAQPNARSFQDWVTQRFGKRLFEHFFKSYSEKLWGIPTHELDADFAAQRIKGFSLGAAVIHALRPKQRHATLVEQFAYPTHGTGELYARMHRAIQVAGGQVHLESPVQSVQLQDGRVSGLQVANGQVQAFDHVISSMPLTHLVERLPQLPSAIQQAAAALRFRNTVLVYLLIDSEALFPDQWLYIHSTDLGVGRITNYRNWVPELPAPDGQTVISLEYWCYTEDDAWQANDPKWGKRAEKEFRHTGLLGTHRVMAHKVIRLPRCYPVYQLGYREHLRNISAYLQTLNGLQVIGRYGAFKYNNQDHSLLMGLLAADNLLHNSGHDLWSVNTDYAYQERAFIRETGLVEES